MNRMTGLIIIEARNSNPNGDPDRESDPRQRPDGRGEISPVSLKRKVRDLIENKAGPVWQHFRTEFPDNEFEILESRNRDRQKISAEAKDGTFTNKYWDARVFGNTFLEKELSSHIRTGVVQMGVGISLAPISVIRNTFTNKAGVQEDKDRGMAPLAFRVVEHAVYAMPFFVNPSAASKSGCTDRDIDLLLKILPFVYPHTRSMIRSDVDIRNIHTFSHSNPLGSISDFKFLDAITPHKHDDPDKPSTSFADYDAPTWSDIKEQFANKGSYHDYMNG